MTGDPIIGIDLGSYNSGASVLMDGVPTILRSREGLSEQGAGFPSFVEFDGSGELLRVGEVARRAAGVHPERVVWGAKRLIGRAYRDVRQNGDHARFQYRIVEGPDGACQIVVGSRHYTPTEVASFILAKIKSDAEAAFNPIGSPVRDCVITVPAYFGPLQKAETKRAAELAGFDGVLLIPEPTSAALAYRVRLERTNQYIVVVDLGAGTLDVTVALLYTDAGQLRTQELGHGGDTALGGIDIDRAIADSIARKHKLKRVLRNPVANARFGVEVERAKIRLSTAETAHISFAHERSSVDVVAGRAEIEAAAAPWIDSCRRPIRIALREAGVAPVDVAHVLLVGGPAHMPSFRAMVASEFQDNPQVLAEIASIGSSGFPVDPMEAVASGAVLGSFGSITPHGYGIMMAGAYFEMIPRRSQYPCENSRVVSLPGGGKSVRLGLIQHEIDPHSDREIYTELSSYRFDYVPEPSGTRIEVEARFTEDGTLDFTTTQVSRDVSMRLSEVNQFEGRRIRTPSSPLPPGTTPRPPSEPPPPPSGNAPTEPTPEPSAAWSQQQLDDNIRVANQVLQIARNRSAADPEAAGDGLTDSLARLEDAIHDPFHDVGTRTPRIANLVRQVCHELRVRGLLTHDEAAKLARGVDGAS